MKWSSDNKIWKWLPRLQSHRGYWVEGAPQNTLKSVQQAYELGYEIVEFDVRLTADEKVILFHDSKFKNKFISDTNYADLKVQTEVTTLRVLLDWFVNTKPYFKINIEIKNDGMLNYEIERQVCALIDEYKVESRVLISSFNPLTLSKVKYYNAHIYRALLLSFENEHGNNWFVMSGIMNLICEPHILHLRYEDFLKHKVFFKNLAAKVPLVLWTVNDLLIYKNNRDLVYGVISDRIKPQDLN